MYLERKFKGQAGMFDKICYKYLVEDKIIITIIKRKKYTRYSTVCI
jgi:hypothetical protein